MTRTMMLAMLTAPLVAWGQEPVVVGASYTVNNSPGTQTDPHVSGDVVAYTNESSTSSEIRYHFLSTSNDQGIPNGGQLDFLSDVHGSRIVFSRFTGTARGIHVYDVFAGTQSELAPGPGVVRNHAVIGGNTVIWVDNGLTGSSSTSVIVAYDLTTGGTTNLTGTSFRNTGPAVSPDGNTAAWAQCNTSGQNCDIHLAQLSGGSWTSSAITGLEGSEVNPATDGQIIAYESLRSVGGDFERDIYYQPVGSGTATAISLGGSQQNPSVAGQLIAFEHQPGDGSQNSDILLYDTRTGILYQLTDTPEQEFLSDIDVDPATGVVRVVYVRRESGDDNVYAFSFVVQEPPTGCETGPAPDETCADPSARALLAELVLVRSPGAPDSASASFSSTEGTPGLVCVANGAPTGKRATSGKVKLNGATVVNASAYKKATAGAEANVVFESSNLVEAKIAGTKGSSFTVSVYGNLTGCAGDAATTAASLQVRDVGGKDLKTIRGQALGRFTKAGDEPQIEALGGIVGGCSSTGAGAPLMALLGLGLFVLVRSSRRAATLRVRR